MLKLQIITCSTRQGRLGPAVAAWFTEQARAHGKFEIEPVDLAQVALPLFDEPNHPSQQRYMHEHTRRWSAVAQRADAYVFVTPEYDYGPPPSLVNALHYLYREWNYKPAAFVSYGGVSGGSRSVQVSKQTLGALKMVPIVEAVTLPFFQQHLNEQTGAFRPPEHQDKAAAALLDELLRWAEALKLLRGA